MTDQNQLKSRLETEQTRLKTELQDLEQPDQETETEFKDEVADRLEEQEDREATTNTLKTRLIEVERALERLNNNTYGQCLVCHQEIESDRLEANPAATTCKQHLE